MEQSGKLCMCPRKQKADATKRHQEDVAGEDIFDFDTDMTEDCPSLNVFVPIDTEAGGGLPVLVNISGGNFHYTGRERLEYVREEQRREELYQIPWLYHYGHKC
jgi:carboxylesterase type B